MLKSNTFIARLLSKSRYAAYLAAILLVILGLMNVVHNLTYRQPTDGAQWQMQQGSLTAVSTSEDQDAIFQVGDILLSINDEEIDNKVTYEDYLLTAAEHSKHLYIIEREGTILEHWVRIRPTESGTDFAYYLFATTGFFYLIFSFLILSQGLDLRAKPYLIAFCFFVFLNFVFHYTNRLTLLDWMAFYLDKLGGFLLPSCLASLALTRILPRFRWLPFIQAMHWVPSVLFLAFLLYWVPQISEASILLGEEYFNQLIHIQSLWAGSLIVISVVAMAARSRVASQKPSYGLFWLIAWLPYAAFLWNLDYPFATVTAALAPILLPLALIAAWSRKGDLYLGEIGKRALVYLSVVFVLILGYFLFISIFQALLGARIGRDTQMIISGLGIMSAAMSYAPLKHYSAELLDRLLYGERFESIKSLLDFSGFNRADVEIEDFLNLIQTRVDNAFLADRVAVYRSKSSSKTFQSLGAPRERSTIVFETLEPELLQGGIIRGYQARAYTVGKDRESPFRPEDYVCPIRVSDVLAALIVIGPKSAEARLTPEELDLLRNLLNQCDILMENMKLYQNLAEKADSMNKLKEYSDNIIESTRIGILTTDEMGRAVSFNHAFEELCGLTRDDIMGKPLEACFERTDLVNQRQVRAGFLAEVQFTTFNGEEVAAEIQRTPLKTRDNQVYGTLYLVEDIREKKVLRSKMMQQEKLASIGLLAAGVAHEINTPLTGIASYAQFLTGDSNITAEQKELLDLILAQSHRATNIVGSLLNFSRKENAPKGPVKLGEVLDQTLRFLSHQIQKSKMRVTVKEVGFQPEIEGYPNQLQQVFVNLIVNAMDAMPEGGDLTITFQRRREMVEMIFADSGIGMDDTTRERIFDPFFTTKEVGKGTGLGLAVVYNILQDHGAGVEVESKTGKGTRFRLFFPLSENAQSADLTQGETHVVHHGLLNPNDSVEAES